MRALLVLFATVGLAACNPTTGVVIPPDQQGTNPTNPTNATNLTKNNSVFMFCIRFCIVCAMCRVGDNVNSLVQILHQ